MGAAFCGTSLFGILDEHGVDGVEMVSLYTKDTISTPHRYVSFHACTR